MAVLTVSMLGQKDLDQATSTMNRTSEPVISRLEQGVRRTLANVPGVLEIRPAARPGFMEIVTDDRTLNDVRAVVSGKLNLLVPKGSLVESATDPKYAQK